MQIIGLTDETRNDYFTCLEEWSEEMKDGACRKECWYDSMQTKGLRVLLATNDAGVVAGMIHYAPIEHSWVEGKDLYFVYCIWVHGHKKGRGDLRKQGIGTALLQAAEDDVKNLKAKGLVVWGLVMPVFMRASWFRKHGYRKADRKGISMLLWKRFAEDAAPPQWIRAKKRPEPVPGKVVVTALANGWCSAIDGTIERARKVCAELGDDVVFREVDSSSREAVRIWGLSDALFVDDRNIYRGPPICTDRIRKSILKKLQKLRA